MELKKIIAIKPISKIDFWKRTERKKPNLDILGEDATKKQISFTSIFDDYITSPENLDATYNRISDQSLISKTDYEFARRWLVWIDTYFVNWWNFLNIPDLVFAYRILRVVYKIYSLAYPDWSFNLWETPKYIANDFQSMKFEVAGYYDFLSKKDADFIAQMVLVNLEKYNIKNSIVVMHFFWSAEMFQILLMAEYLKKNGNTIILDATGANEQVDYTQWITTIQESGDLFKNIDYYIPYQDYGLALQKIVQITNQDIAPEDANLENVLYRNQKGEFMPFVKPWKPDADELFDQFCKFYHVKTEKGGDGRDGIRLFPYKCFWSGCFFCTINTTHLYPYDPKGSIRYINATLDYMEKNNISRISFSDEAISPNDLLTFAKEKIRRNIRGIYRVRTRFDRSYTKENCDIFYESGLRFVGIGLEAANEEVNNSVNKGHNLSKNEIQEIINNFNAAGVAFHNYSIMWFPHETPENVTETFEFLSENINTQNNYNCTPNIFGLNKGSYMYAHPEKFQLPTITPEIQKQNLMNLRINFRENAEKKDLFKIYQREIHRQQFMPWVQKDSGFSDYSNFWVFIDRTGHYYFLKTVFSKSPFFLYKHINKDLLQKSDDEILDTKVCISPYIQIFKTEREGRYRVYNWVEFSNIFADSTLLNFIRSFDPEKTLRENITSIGADEEDILVRILLEKRFLLSRIGPDIEHLDQNFLEFFE